MFQALLYKFPSIELYNLTAQFLCEGSFHNALTKKCVGIVYNILGNSEVIECKLMYEERSFNMRKFEVF
jgi:hypothetical protein